MNRDEDVPVISAWQRFREPPTRRIQLDFDPQDWTIGVAWWVESWESYRNPSIEVWIHFLPMLCLHVRWLRTL